MILPPKKAPRMPSHMITNPGFLPKPWSAARSRTPRAIISHYLVYAVVAIGAAIGALQCYLQYKGVMLDRQPLCLVFEENFDDAETVFGQIGTKGGSFMREVNMDGFGFASFLSIFPFSKPYYRNGEFEMTTASTNNSFVKDGYLYIVPTLTSDSLGSNAIVDNTVYNITGCTFNITRPDNGYIIKNGQRVFDSDSYYKSCSRVANATAGTIINPVQSARLTTRYSASIKYGRVEIKAKMPTG
jgi:hypothetical protein